MTARKSSFPFLQIAKQHGVEYADVLAIAHTEIDRTDLAMQRASEAAQRLPWEKHGAVVMDIHAACRELSRERADAARLRVITVS